MHRDYRFAGALGLVLAFLPAASGSVPTWLAALRESDKRVAEAAFLLSTRAADFCSARAKVSGIVVEDLAQFPAAARADAARALQLGTDPVISAVVANSSAAGAGLLPGDMLRSINKVRVPSMPHSKNADASRVTAVQRTLELAAVAGPVTLEVVRNGEPLSLRFNADRGCGGRVEVSTSSEIEGAADGAVAEVSTGAIGFAADDAEMAAVIAHEMAHNILKHQARLDTAHVHSARSLRGARLTLATEIEADRLSVYLLDRAGYDPFAAARFWSRVAARRAQTTRQRTHLPAEDRASLLLDEAARIVRLKREGKPLVPYFLSAGLPPLE